MTLVFLIPFQTHSSEMTPADLARRLDLTVTRVDDWDSQVGFMLIGATGAATLFQQETSEGHRARAFELQGTAVAEEDVVRVRDAYDRFFDRVLSMNASIDQSRLVTPNRPIGFGDFRL